MLLTAPTTTDIAIDTDALDVAAISERTLPDLETEGHHEAAVQHLREAHRLVPDNFSYKRQAWSLEPGPEGPPAHFWQGPSDADPEAWPHEGDRVTDVRQFGAENDYPAREA